MEQYIMNGETFRNQMEESGEILREKENVQGQSDNTAQNQWEEAMKDMPSFEEHMKEMESENEMELEEEEMSM